MPVIISVQILKIVIWEKKKNLQLLIHVKHDKCLLKLQGMNNMSYFSNVFIVYVSKKQKCLMSY